MNIYNTISDNMSDYDESIVKLARGINWAVFNCTTISLTDIATSASANFTRCKITKLANGECWINNRTRMFVTDDSRVTFNDLLSGLCYVFKRDEADGVMRINSVCNEVRKEALCITYANNASMFNYRNGDVELVIKYPEADRSFYIFPITRNISKMGEKIDRWQTAHTALTAHTADTMHMEEVFKIYVEVCDDRTSGSLQINDCAICRIRRPSDMQVCAGEWQVMPNLVYIGVVDLLASMLNELII